MLLITPILVALIIGPIVAISVHSRKGLGRNILVSLFGSFIMRFGVVLIGLSTNKANNNSFSVSLISSLLGAIAFTYVYNLLPELDDDDES